MVTEDDPESVSDIIKRVIPALYTKTVDCPHHVGIHDCPIRAVMFYFGGATLNTIIIHLNDSCHWSRERIADWLETLDVDLSFPIGELQ